MNPTDYQNAASRTECVYAASLERIKGEVPPGWLNEFQNDTPTLARIRLNHAVIGLCGESGELASVLQKIVYFGKNVSPTELRQMFKDELGDVLWYVALACNTLGLDLGEVMAANISKLKARYPEKYTDHDAADENRDRAKEADAVSKAGS